MKRQNSWKHQALHQQQSLKWITHMSKEESRHYYAIARISVRNNDNQGVLNAIVLTQVKSPTSAIFFPSFSLANPSFAYVATMGSARTLSTIPPRQCLNPAGNRKASRLGDRNCDDNALAQESPFANPIVQFPTHGEPLVKIPFLVLRSDEPQGLQCIILPWTPLTCTANCIATCSSPNPPNVSCSTSDPSHLQTLRKTNSDNSQERNCQIGAT